MTAIASALASLILAGCGSPGVTAAKSETPKATVKFADGSTVYVTRDTLCATGLGSIGALADAGRTSDYEAVQGLVGRGKALMVTKATRFDIGFTKDSIVYGFLRGGRNSGESCWMFEGGLQMTAP